MFNNRLNNSFSKPKKAESLFYKHIDSMLKSTFNSMNKKRQALIIGSGKMDEFSLHLFLKTFGKVVVTDIDISSAKRVVSDMDLSKKLKQKLFLEEIEYTGFDQFHFFEDFRTQIANMKSNKEIEIFIDEKIKKIKTYQFLEHCFKKYDFVYVSPIYTQLIYNQVLLECSLLRNAGYPENLLKFIEDKMIDEMIPIIDRFNSNLIKFLHEDGILLVLSDIFEVNVDSDFDRRVKHSINNKDVMDSIYDNYSTKYGMGFGDYGLYSLDERISSLKHRWFIWPFNENTNLVIKLKIYNEKLL